MTVLPQVIQGHAERGLSFFSRKEVGGSFAHRRVAHGDRNQSSAGHCRNHASARLAVVLLKHIASGVPGEHHQVLGRDVRLSERADCLAPGVVELKVVQPRPVRCAPKGVL